MCSWSPPVDDCLSVPPEVRMKMDGKSAVAIERLSHRVLVGLPAEFIQRRVACALVVGVRDREVKQHLLMGGVQIA